MINLDVLIKKKGSTHVGIPQDVSTNFPILLARASYF
jgi:hypothetical protein